MNLGIDANFFFLNRGRGKLLSVQVLSIVTLQLYLKRFEVLPLK